MPQVDISSPGEMSSFIPVAGHNLHVCCVYKMYPDIIKASESYFGKWSCVKQLVLLDLPFADTTTPCAYCLQRVRVPDNNYYESKSSIMNSADKRKC